MVRVILAFLTAAVIAAALGSSASTHFVMEGLRDIGVAITSQVQLDTTLKDLMGMAPLYAGMLSPGLIIAFVAAHYVSKVIGLRTLVFMAAGGAAVGTTLFSTSEIMGLMPIGGARTDLGFSAQAAAGAAAGLIFALLKRA